ncbi:CLUMA_CG021118, isoform A [Clunio marinus]|uniref:CLUMA_CG021118, isoform A n=1 Tax=Clunio marinus TaxID=568069 RepID=A0A1J1J6G3_9DIPT|nr:CLUMA_CG021118, isoform A [Clunio marinus]
MNVSLDRIGEVMPLNVRSQGIWNIQNHFSSPSLLKSEVKLMTSHMKKKFEVHRTSDTSERNF